MPEHAELAVVGKVLEHARFERDRRVVGQPLEDRAVKDEEAAVDPALPGLRLLFERGDRILVQAELAEAVWVSMPVSWIVTCQSRSASGASITFTDREARSISMSLVLFR